jgi:uncharacterized protein
MNETTTPPGGWRPLFRADWTRFVFIHYALPPGDLAPWTPLELDCREGQAFVSLVLFRLDRMRPACLRPDFLGRTLFRPASDNWFLNVRTYVRGPAGPGIQFLIEWMDNPVSLFLGPRLYGLPYRAGTFDFLAAGAEGRTRMRVTDPKAEGALHLSVLEDAEPRGSVRPGSMDAFLLEKYTAYTHHRGVSRYFHIAHPHWSVARPAELDIDDTLVRASCPWFARARMLSAHTSAGFKDVAMGYPHRLGKSERGTRPTPVLFPARQPLE